VRRIQGQTLESSTDTSAIVQPMDNAEPRLTNHYAVESTDANGVSQEGMRSEVHTFTLQRRFPQRADNRRNVERASRRMCKSLRTR
jgi:hypothetical protein